MLIRPVMVAAMASMLPALTGCNESDPTFGESYDECILKNAKGETPQSVHVATNACRRHFERKVLYTLQADGRVRSPDNNPYITFSINNDKDDEIITQVDVEARFFETREDLEAYEKEGDQVHSFLTWTVSEQIEPGESINPVGNFDGKATPTDFWTVSAVATRAIPVGSALD